MKPAAIPETLSICAVCEDALAMAGKRECYECLLDRRFAAWALADGEEIPHFEQPRITEVPAASTPHEVPLPQGSQVGIVARRGAVRVALVMLWVFALGWLFGRFTR